MDPRPADAPADGSKSGLSRAPPPPPADGRSKRGRSPADAPADGRSTRGRSSADRRSKRGSADESKMVVSPAPPYLPPGCPNLPPGWRYDPSLSSPAAGSKRDLSSGPLSPADGSKMDRSAPPPTDGLRSRRRPPPPPPPPPSDDGFTRGGMRSPPSPDGSLIAPRRPADGSKWGGTSATGPRPADGSKRSWALAPPRPADGSSCFAFGSWLGHSGIILVLFETPSGFAVLHYDGVKLFRPNSLENIWTEFIDLPTALNAVTLKEFKIFEDKTGAINSDGVSSELAKMINRSLRPGQKLAVAKKEYKDVIERNLGIDCLFESAVLELMWGLKNLIKVLVPDEKLELTNEDRSQISLGMNEVLRRHSVEADANLVNSEIINIAATVYETDRLIGARGALLRHYGEKLSVVSGIDYRNWDQLKLATALKLVCYPEEEGLHEELLSETDVKTLMKDAHLYKVKFDKRTCLDMFKKIVWASGIRFQALAAIRYIVKETKNGLKLHQGSSMAEEAKNGLKLKEEQQ